MPIPLSTERLTIRPFSPAEDAEAMHRVWGDPEVMRYIPREPSKSADEVRASLEGLVRAAFPPGLGAWAIERKEDGAVLGVAALLGVESKGPEVEVAYHLGRAFWGLGYATEAARACVSYGFEEVGLDHIMGLTYPANVASQQVLEKIGMKRRGLTSQYYNTEMVAFDLPRAERQGA